MQSNCKVIFIPHGCFQSNNDSEKKGAEDAAKRRRELREKLLRGESVSISQNGQIDNGQSTNQDQPKIIVPKGKLANSFYWYEKKTWLFEEEKKAMKQFFPSFELDKLPDGRLFWHGIFDCSDLRPGSRWYIQAVYENNHPNNNSYGGSIKIYSIDPVLEDMNISIPHVLTDSAGLLYICTARKEDFNAQKVKSDSTGDHKSTSAASALAWAAKWIAAFELWQAGDLSREEFAGHLI